MNIEKLRLDGGELYIPARDIQSRVEELGQHYTEHFGNEEVVLLTMMNGAKFFSADLMRHIRNLSLIDDNMRMISRNGISTDGEAEVDYVWDTDLKDRVVLIAEDIWDTGKL